VRRLGRGGWLGAGAAPAAEGVAWSAAGTGADCRGGGAAVCGGGDGGMPLLEPLDQSADEAGEVFPGVAGERGVDQGDAEQRPEQDEEEQAALRGIRVLGAAFPHRRRPAAVERVWAGGRHEHM
jgi:hypothetical protein